MRFNAKELSSLALQPSHKFDKEGVLLLREKQGSYFRRTDVFTERWCRLRGNLLFYFKSKDQCSEPVGVIILERCSIKLDDSQDLPYLFTLVFDDDDKIQQMVAQSENERDSWIQVLHMASYEYMRSQLEGLRGKIASRCGKSSPSDTSSICSDVDSVVKRIHAKSVSGDSSDWFAASDPFVEINISCDNLMCDGDGTAPNPIVMMFTITPPQTQWVKFAQTEIVERSSNPYFLTTFGLSRSDIVMSTRIKLAVYDVRERLTSTMTLLGQSIVTVGNLLQADKGKLRLTLISAEFAGVGFISIHAKQIEADSKSITSTIIPGNFTPKNSSPPEEAKVANNRPRSQSLPTRLLPGWKTSISTIPPSLLLDLLCDNSVVQSYRFHTGLGADLSVQETMAEIKMAANFPCLLLKFWIKDEKQYMENVTCLGNLKPEWTARQMDVLERHLEMVKMYTQAADYITCHVEGGTYYKKSASKANVDIEFMPVNFHVQRLAVRNVSTRKHGMYDVFTVGGFTAISRKSKSGGLFSMLSHFSKSPSFNGQKWTTGEDADALGKMCETLWTLRQLRKRLLVCIEALIKHSDNKSINGMQVVMSTICSLAKEMMSCCNAELVESSMMILEQARTPDNSKPINQLMESREGTPLKVVKVKNVSHGSTQPSDTLLSKSLPSHAPEMFTEVYSNGTDTFLMPEEADSAEHNKCINHNTPLKQSFNKNTAMVDERMMPNKNIQSSKIPAEANYNNLDGTIPNNDDYMKMSATELSSILASDVFSSKSVTIEPEPMDLTKLNIEASVMCMLSKINNFAQHGSTNYLADLVPSIRKLKQAVDVLLHTIRITNGVFALMETQQRSNERYMVRHRRDIVFSHALTSVVSGLMTKFWCTTPVDDNFLNRLHSAGVLVQFEGLLTCHGDELAMIEDMMIAINDLKSVKFKLECVNSKEYSYPEPRVEGSRFAVTVVLPVRHEVYLAIPNELQTSSHFSVFPVFFNIGINEQASFAEKFGDLSMQEFINKDNAAKLSEYFSQYQNIPVTQSVRGRRYNNQDIPVTELLNRLNTQVNMKKSKNTEVLQLAAEICRRLCGLRFTSCKSAKDRTSMSVTLEQCNLLQRYFDLDEREFSRALNCMRSEGVRRENTMKNAGVRKYAFNSLQLLTLPKLYRPPAGTFGNYQT